jgi:transposase InsO family protein
MATQKRRSTTKSPAPRFWAPTGWLGWLSVLCWASLRPRADLVLENLALRQQLGVLRRAVKRPKVTDSDRLLWLMLRRLHAGWSGLLAIVSPDTVLRWHKAGFRALWRSKSAHRIGRPEIPRKLYCLIRKLSRENPLWGARRIAAELELLGWKVGSSTVNRYMARRRPRSGQGWKTFLRNTMGVTAACDFFVVPTVGFRRLFAFVVLEHDRRRIRHVAVTAHPSAAWMAQQVVLAYPEEAGRPVYLVHDRQRCFTSVLFQEHLRELQIEDRTTAPRQCWQNAYCERVIETLRHECTDHVLVLAERQLERLLREYAAYYNASRTHLSLERNAPWPRAREPTPASEFVATPVLGGLHHSYTRAA